MGRDLHSDTIKMEERRNGESGVGMSDKLTVTVRKVTGIDLMHEAFSCTAGHEVTPTLEKAYKWEHSPIRTQMFVVKMHIPTYVSVHYVRHKVWCEHFVKSNRADRGGEAADRNTMVDHMMFLNAEALLGMARKRLCSAADPTTRKVMEMIHMRLLDVDYDLSNAMGPTCEYRGGICPEPKCCGRNKEYMKCKN